MASRRGASRFTRPTRDLRVLVDMDGVIADFESHLEKVIRENHPDIPCIALQDRTTFYAADQYYQIGGDELKKKVSDIINSPGFYRNIPPMENAIDAVKELSGMDGVEIFFCTSHNSGSNYSASEKLDWIAEYFGQDWTKRVILSQDKTLIIGDLLIDDKPNVGGTVRQPSWRQILFNYWNNQGFDIKERPIIITRMDGWAEESKWKSIVEQYKSRIA